MPQAAASALPPDVQLSYEVSTSVDFESGSLVAEGRAVAHAQEHYHAKAAISGLRPGQRYYFRFSASGLVSPPGSFIIPATPHAGEWRACMSAHDNEQSERVPIWGRVCAPAYLCHVDASNSLLVVPFAVKHCSAATRVCTSARAPACVHAGHQLAHIAPLRAGSGSELASSAASASARRLQQGGSNFTFQLLHINDQHNRIEGIQSSGAACSAANEVRQAKGSGATGTMCHAHPWMHRATAPTAQRARPSQSVHAPCSCCCCCCCCCIPPSRGWMMSTCGSNCCRRRHGGCGSAAGGGHLHRRLWPRRQLHCPDEGGRQRPHHGKRLRV